MRGFVWAAVLAGLGASGCSKDKESLVDVSLTANPADTGLTSVQITVRDVVKTFTIMSGGIGADASHPVTFGVYVPSSVTGTGLPVGVTATGDHCYNGSSSVDIASAGVTVSVTVPLTPGLCPSGAGGTGGTGVGAGGAGGSAAGGAGGSSAGGAGGSAAGGAGGSSAGGAGGSSAGGAGGSSADAGTDGPPQVVDPPSLNNCTTIQQFANDTTDWGISQVAFSPDGHYLATGDQSGNTKLWTMNGKTATAEGHTLPSGTGGNMLPAFSPNGMLIAAATSNGGMSMWSVGGNWNKKGDFIGNPALSNVVGVAFTPDSSQVVIVDYDTSTMQTFSASTLMMAGSRTLTAKPEALAIAQAPSGSALWAAVGLADGTVAVYNLNAAPTQAPLTALVSSTDDANAVAFNHDGSLLAVGGGILDTRVTLWNVSTAGLTPHAPAPNLGTNALGGVAGIAFSPDARNLVVSYGFRTVAVSIFEVATGQNHGTTAPQYTPLGVSFSPHGDVVVVGEADYGWTLVCGD
jgi:hypothetical protein